MVQIVNKFVHNLHNFTTSNVETKVKAHSIAVNDVRHMMQRDFIPTVSFHLVLKPIRIILCTLHWILLLFIVFRSTANAWIPTCCRSPTGFPGSRVAGSTNRFSSIYYRKFDSSESLKRQKLNSYRFTLIRSTERNTECADTGEVWQVGNVDDDFKNLEREIMYSNADQNLLHEERVEALNYFAQQRIPIASVMRKSLMIPLMASFVISHFLHMLIDHKHIPRTLHAMAFICQQFIRCISLAQFLSVVVVAPAVLLGLILHKKRKINAATPEDPMEPISEHFDNLQYLVAKSKSIDNKRALPSSSTRDYVQCLLEQWISCTFGMSLSGFIWFVASIVKPGSVQISPCGVLFLQLLTRFGVMSSLQQYQSIWFALTRKQQPCPLPWLIWATQTLATNALNVWFVVLDVVSLSLLSPALRHILPAMVASTVLLWYSVILLERLMMKASSVDQAQYRFKTSKLLTQMQQLFSFCTKAFFAWSFWNCGPMMSKAFQRLWFASTRGTPLARRIAWSNVVSIFSIAVAIVGPVCHLLAMQKLIHISYSHNTSLAIKSDQFDKTTLLPNGDESWKWRYKLRWREPQRVHTTLRKWWDDFWYVLFFRGSVDEKLRQDQQRRLRENGAKARGLTVLQKVAAEDPLMNPSGNDRTQWKIKAMERIAQKHQEDYSIGSFDVSTTAIV